MNTTHIWTDPARMCGKPCIRNTRFPLGQLIAEIAQGATTAELVQDFRLSEEAVVGALEDLAQYLDQVRLA